MLQIKVQGLTLGDLRTNPITEIMQLFFKYQSEEREEVLHGYSRILALASDAAAVLQDTDYDYNIRYINRHATFQMYKKVDYYCGITADEYRDMMHPLEVVRIMETEEGA
jgi:hypothetical protein